MIGNTSSLINEDGFSFVGRSIETGIPIRIIGKGSLGGKAQGLFQICDVLFSEIDSLDFPQITMNIPNMVVIGTDIFDQFMERNNLYEVMDSELPDDRIAMSFQKAELPFEALGDLRRLISKVHTPLAVRSSSLLEDSTYEPFAGVYATKMIPNNQYDVNIRFRKLVEAIKFVYASTYFKSAKDYIRATKHQIEGEKMAVIIQEEVGKRFGDRFYPELSGVARSYNFYPMGRANHEDGVVHLALGLGKIIVDGGISWSYSPALPKVDPPYRSVKELLKQTQVEFWAVNMGEPAEYNPIKETEYLLLESITRAEKDGVLRHIASTYDPNSSRLYMGTSMNGPRVLTFAPLLVLEEIPLNQLIIKLLEVCENALGGPVEIEFAMTLNPNRFGFLQVRRMSVFDEEVEINEIELAGDNVLLASENVLGNGVTKFIEDVIYIKPECFDIKHTREIAKELTEINRVLLDAGKSYLLIVFGRLGTTDPWLGIPIEWGQISGARAIVEATKEKFNVVLSQGSHYFHNLTNLSVSYFSIPFGGKYSIDWEWLERQDIVHENQYIRHVKVPVPLTIMVDGRRGRGVVHKS
ncbi:MAG: PEP/pyruvate-binding domain-containing protein [Anaerolineales bacterium]|jgi:hypothetical protein